MKVFFNFYLIIEDLFCSDDEIISKINFSNDIFQNLLISFPKLSHKIILMQNVDHALQRIQNIIFNDFSDSFNSNSNFDFNSQTVDVLIIGSFHLVGCFLSQIDFHF